MRAERGSLSAVVRKGRPGPVLEARDFKRAFARFQKDQATDHAAALTRTTRLLSLFPALLFGVALLGFFGQQGADHGGLALPDLGRGAERDRRGRHRRARGRAAEPRNRADGARAGADDVALRRLRRVRAAGRALNAIWRVEEGRGFVKHKAARRRLDGGGARARADHRRARVPGRRAGGVRLQPGRARLHDRGRRRYARSAGGAAGDDPDLRGRVLRGAQRRDPALPLRSRRARCSASWRRLLASAASSSTSRTSAPTRRPTARSRRWSSCSSGCGCRNVVLLFGAELNARSIDLRRSPHLSERYEGPPLPRQAARRGSLATARRLDDLADRAARRRRARPRRSGGGSWPPRRRGRGAEPGVRRPAARPRASRSSGRARRRDRSEMRCSSAIIGEAAGSPRARPAPARRRPSRSAYVIALGVRAPAPARRSRAPRRPSSGAMRRSRSGRSESTSTTPSTSPGCSEANSCAFMPPQRRRPRARTAGSTPAFSEQGVQLRRSSPRGCRGFGPGSDAAIPARSQRQTRVQRATAGRTAAHVEVESTPSRDVRATTVGAPSPLHSMNMPWPSTRTCPRAACCSDCGAQPRAASRPAPPGPATRAHRGAARRPRATVSQPRRGRSLAASCACRTASPRSGCSRIRVRARARRPRLGVRAQRAPARAVGAQVAVRALRDLVALVEHAAGERDDLLGEGGRVGRGVDRDDRLARALEEAVGDVDPRGAVAQRRRARRRSAGWRSRARARRPARRRRGGRSCSRRSGARRRAPWRSRRRSR